MSKKNQCFFAASTVTVNASAEDIWNVLEDVRGWIFWDQRFEKIEFEGLFSTGSKFKIFRLGETPQSAEFKAVTANTFFSYEAKIPLFLVIHSHHFEKLGSYTKVTCEIKSIVEEDLIDDFSKNIWPQMQIGLPIAVNNLVSLVETC
jgi:hypothetical protein